MNIAIVVSDFNTKITGNMEKIAKRRAIQLGAKITKIIHVPGAFEIPFAVNKLLKKKNIHGVITLGAVIKGETDHDNVVAYNSASHIMELSLKYNKPVSLGILGPNITKKQAEARFENYAIRAAEATIKLLEI